MHVENLAVTRDKYSADRFVYLREFVPLGVAQRFEEQTRTLPAERVYTHSGGVSWEQQIIPNGNELCQFFNSRGLIDLVLSILGVNTDSNWRSICWTSRYAVGEYIDNHKDTDGTTQLIVCLQNSGKENGGMLILNSGGQESRIFLEAGDAILFEATSIEHCTTPLIRTKVDGNPVRVTAVARYYLTDPDAVGV